MRVGADWGALKSSCKVGRVGRGAGQGATVASMYQTCRLVASVTK